MQTKGYANVNKVKHLSSKAITFTSKTHQHTYA